MLPPVLNNRDRTSPGAAQTRSFEWSQSAFCLGVVTNASPERSEKLLAPSMARTS